LTLYFRDDERAPAEEYTLLLDGANVATQTISSGPGATSSFSYNVQAQMDPDGLLLVRIERTGSATAAANDFFFEKSTVDATFDETGQTTPAPEPGSIFLLGTALAGAALHRRRRSSSSSM
jgi:hypothetical protein